MNEPLPTPDFDSMSLPQIIATLRLLSEESRERAIKRERDAEQAAVEAAYAKADEMEL